MRWFAETRAGRRTLIGVSCLLAVIGLAFLAYPWLTDIYTKEIVQSQLRADYETKVHTEAAKVAYEKHTVKEGEGLTRIIIPKLGVDTIVVEGTTPSALRAGAGHYPASPLPGENGNMDIAGHRTTYGKPFADIDQLTVGDEIDFDTPVGFFVYRVTQDPFIVDPSDISVLDATPEPTVTLTACHPKFSAAQRIIVKGALDPVATAQHPQG